jgi:ubiquinone biosynthesis protein
MWDVVMVRRVRLAFERLGPTFVKLGQLISSSPGSFSPVWVNEMAHCRDNVPPISWDDVSKVITSELGDRRRHLLQIDQTPLAAGSMAQVHVARLTNGDHVVVKVQRPNLANILGQDVRLLRLAARWATRIRTSLVAANPEAIIEEFASSLAHQVSFRAELANMERMRTILVSENIRIPRVYPALSTERVLVMEQIDGVGIDKINLIDDLGIDRSRLASTVVAGLMVGALKSGVFHGDLHAGNLLVLASGEVALLDFGVVGRLDRSVRTAVSDLFSAVASRRFEAIAAAMLQLVDLGTVSLGEIVEEVQDVVSSFLDRPLAELDVRAALGGMLHMAKKHGLVLPSSVVPLFKQVIYLDGVCRALDPSYNLIDGCATLTETFQQASTALCRPTKSRAIMRSCGALDTSGPGLSLNGFGTDSDA